MGVAERGPKTRLTNTLAALLKFQIGEVRS